MRFKGLIDSIYHVVNLKYKLGVGSSLEFRGNVVTKLRQYDKDLSDYLKSLPDKPIYKKVNQYRNDFVDNYRPNQIDSRLIPIPNLKRLKIVTMTVGNYTTSTEFLNNIKESLSLLADITDVIRGKIKSDIALLAG